jgi:hypothetical protein
MEKPYNRSNAESFNEQQRLVIANMNFEIRYNFLKAIGQTMANAMGLATQEQEQLQQFYESDNNTGKLLQYRHFIQTNLPTSQDESDKLIDTPTVSCRLATGIDEHNQPYGNQLEIHLPLSANHSMQAGPADIQEITEVYIIEKEAVTASYTGAGKYFYVNMHGASSYTPFSISPKEHDVEFAFFVDNAKNMLSNIPIANKELLWHGQLINMVMVPYGITEINLRAQTLPEQPQKHPYM